MQIDQMLRSYKIVNNAPLLNFYAIQTPALTVDGQASVAGGFTGFMGSGTVVLPVYGPNITLDLSLGNTFSIIATNGVAFTLLAPINGPAGVAVGRLVLIQIKNVSGGALGAVTFTAGAGGLRGAATAWVQPANGNNRSVLFFWDGINYSELCRTGADVPN